MDPFVKSLKENPLNILQSYINEMFIFLTKKKMKTEPKEILACLFVFVNRSFCTEQIILFLFYVKVVKPFQQVKHTA